MIFKYSNIFEVTYTGERRYTPIDLQASIAAGEEGMDFENAFSNQHKNYFRADFEVGFRHNAKKQSQTFSVDLQNFTNNQTSSV